MSMKSVALVTDNEVDSKKLSLVKALNNLAGQDLMSEQDLVNCAVPFRKICGVYFLISKGELVYIGQSIDILQRLGGHLTYDWFDSYSYIECEKADLNLIESIYIHAYRPKGNGQGSKGGKFSPMSFQAILELTGKS